MSDTITMVVKGIRGEKVFTLSSALYILRKQANNKGNVKPSEWSIKKGEPYKFENNELIRATTNRKSKKSAKPGSTTAGPEVPEQA